jgi:hypothetical protein
MFRSIRFNRYRRFIEHPYWTTSELSGRTLLRCHRFHHSSQTDYWKQHGSLSPVTWLHSISTVKILHSFDTASHVVQENKFVGTYIDIVT